MKRYFYLEAQGPADDCEDISNRVPGGDDQMSYSPLQFTDFEIACVVLPVCLKDGSSGSCGDFDRVGCGKREVTTMSQRNTFKQ